MVVVQHDFVVLHSAANETLRLLALLGFPVVFAVEPLLPQKRAPLQYLECLMTCTSLLDSELCQI